MTTPEGNVLEHIITDQDLHEFLDNEDSWAILVWDDPITTFQAVEDACMDFLGHSKERAKKLAILVDKNGKAVVGMKPKEEAQKIVQGFTSRLIQCSMEKA